MDGLIAALQGPWPWYISGPIIGLMVPLLVLVGSRSFGISQNLEHICAITQPRFIEVNFFKYDWKASVWSLVFAVGVILGGFLAGYILPNPEPIQLSTATIDMLHSLGMTNLATYNPMEIFSLTNTNLILLFIGGAFIGFGTRYGSGCTSGHAITGLSTLQPQSLYAVIGIFAGGLFAAHILVPLLLGQ